MKAEETLRPRQLGLLVAIVLLAMALRLYELDADSLWSDEILTASRAQLDLPTLFSRLSSGEGKGVQLPLSYVVTHFFIAGFGVSEFVLRLPPLLSGTLSVLLIYKVGEILWSRHVGLMAALLLAVNPYHVQFSQEARHYALMLFLALVSLIFLVRAIQRNAPSLWIGFVLCSSLSLYNHYFAFLFLPAEVVLAAWLIAENWRSRSSSGDAPAKDPHLTGPTPRAQASSLGLSLVLVALSLLPWAGPMLSVTSSPAGSGQLGVSMASVQASFSFLAKVLVSFSGVEGLAVAVWVGALVLGWARSTARPMVLVALGTGTPFVFLTLMEPNHFLMPKYVLFSLPLYLLAVSRGLAVCADWTQGFLYRQMGERKWPPEIGHALAVLLLSALSMAPLRAYYRLEKEDWRTAAAYLHANASEDDIVVVDGEQYDQGCDSQRPFDALSYYLSIPSQRVTILQAQVGLVESVQQATDAAEGVWGVLWHASDLRDPGPLGEDLEIVQLPNVTLVRLIEPVGDSMNDTASILNALLALQPAAAGRFDLHLALAELYSEMGETARAASQAKLAEQAAHEYDTQIGPGPSPARRGWNWKPYWDLGSTYESLGMLDEATTAYEEVLRRNPSLVQAYLRLGDAYGQLNEPAKSLDAYERAMAIEPENAQLRLRLGQSYQRLGRIEEATLAYQEVLAIEPQNEWAQTMLALLPKPPYPDVPHPMLRSLNLEVALLGYDLYPAPIEGGETLHLRLWWQALAATDRDYTAFIHLTSADGSVVAQEDRLLLRDDLPTSAWRVGLVIEDEYQVQLPRDVEPGDYAVTIGVYYWESGQRLPMWDEQGQREPDDAIVLRGISVTPPDAGI